MAWRNLPAKSRVKKSTQDNPGLEIKGNKSSKYGNNKKEIDGILFDSTKEANRYADLKILEKAGIIRDLSLQVKYVLIPKQTDEKGKVLERECSYIADFVYFDTLKGCTVVEDTKGFRTDDYRIKKKLMLYMHGIRISEI